MRIAIIAGPYTPVPPIHYGGSERVIYYLIRGLLEANHQPILLGPANSKVACELIPTIDKPLGFAKTPKQLATDLKKISNSARITRAELRKLLSNIDIIHSHGFDLKGFEKFPNVTTVHGPIGIEDLDYFEDRQQFRFLSISQNQQDAFPAMSWAGVVYNGEDPKGFPFVSKPDNYLCFLGRMDEQKNPHLAIQLAIKLGIKIKLAGKVDLDGKHYFNKIVKPYFVHPLVEYIGEPDFNAKVDLVSHAVCNLHPTNFREPFGLTVIEAALCGTPTLAVNRGAMSELIVDGKTGMLVEDFVQGYALINKCFTMDRKFIAERARKLFSHTRMTNDYIKAYKNELQRIKAITALN